MAKYCEVCKQSYPDDQLSCPHCAAAPAPVDSSSEVSLGTPPPKPATPVSDSAVDLGATPRRSPSDTGKGSDQPFEMSDVSAIEWAALVNQTVPGSSPSEPVPASHTEAAAESAEGSGIVEVIESAEITAVSGDIQVTGEAVSVSDTLAPEVPAPASTEAGESSVNLGASLPTEGDSSSSVNLGKPDHPQGENVVLTAGPISDSGIDLIEAEDAGPEPFLAEPGSSVGALDASAVNLGADPTGEDAEVLDLAELGFASEETIEAAAGSAADENSGIDLVAEEQVMADQGEPDDASSVNLGLGVPESAEASDASAVNLADVPVPTSPPSESGIDLIEVSMDEGSGVRPLPAPVSKAPPTTLAPRSAPPTTLAPKSAPPTTLGPRSAPPTTLAPKGVPPTTLSPPPQVTMLAPAEAFPNMELAAMQPPDAPDQGAADEIVQATAAEEGPANLVEETLISAPEEASAPLIEDAFANLSLESITQPAAEEVAEEEPAEPARPAETAPSWMEEEEEVLLGAEVRLPSGEGSSSRDLIAEAVESGVDLASMDLPPATGSTDDIPLEPVGSADSSSESVNLEAVGTAPSMPSSAIDLGNPETARPPANEPGNAPSGTESGIDVEVLNPHPSRLETGPVSTGDEEVDLGGMAAQHPSGRGPGSGSGIDVEVLDSHPSLAQQGERRGAVGEMEAEAEEEEGEDEEKPGKKGRAVLSGGSRVLWATLGLLLGVVAIVGLAFAGLDVPKQARKLLGMGGEDKNNKKGGPAAVAHAPPIDKWEYLRHGDLDKAEAAIPQTKENDGKDLAFRGQLRWDRFVEKQALAGKLPPLPASDKSVQDAKTDLNKAVAQLEKNPATAASLELRDALLKLAEVDLYTGNLPGAKAVYEKGVAQFRSQEKIREVFENALNILEGQTPPGAGGPAARARTLNPLLIALLINLQGPPGQNLPGQNPPGRNPPPGQNPPAGQKQAPADVDEAGFDFWKAVKEARAKNYQRARELLAKARDEHNRRRLIHPRKPQNPLSDPREEIFLQCASQLDRLWQIEAQLSSAVGPIAKDSIKAVEQLVQDAAAEAKMRKDVADKLAAAKINAMIEKPTDVSKAVEDLLGQRAKNEKDIAKLTKQVADDKAEAEGLTTKLKKAEATVKTDEMKLEEAAKREKDLKTARDKAEDTIKQARQSLVKAGYLDADAAPAAFLSKLRQTAEIAKMKDPKSEIRKLQAKVERDQATLTANEKRYQDTLAQRWKPEEMLNVWAPLLQRDRNRKDLADKALLDAGRVEADAAATPAQKGQAGVVRGMALRNEDKFAEADKALKQARADLAKDDTAWSSLATEVQNEVAKPADYFLRWADVLTAENEPKKALEVLNRGVLVLPKGSAGLLLARRSELELTEALDRANGRLAADDPLVQAAQKDAAAAVAEGVAEGHYAAGRVAEELGKLDDAIKSYRAAVAAHKDDDAAGSRYRIALARVLTTPKPAPARRPGRPPANPDDFKVGRAPAVRGVPAQKVTRKKGAEALALLVLMGVAFQAPDLPPPPTPAQQEADKLADEVLKSKDASYAARAQAWAIKGLYTRALRTYAEGMVKAGGASARQGRELLRLLNQHPLLMRPETLAVPSPAKAEQYYANGLNFYFDRRYAEAEKAFSDAIENDNQDARYFYFLGLSRMMEGKPGYNENFAQGARLEHQNRPDPMAVSVSLERVQGPARRILNRARTEP